MISNLVMSLGCRALEYDERNGSHGNHNVLDSYTDTDVISVCFSNTEHCGCLGLLVVNFFRQSVA